MPVYRTDLQLPVQSSYRLTRWTAGEPKERQYEAWNTAPAVQTSEKGSDTAASDE